MKMTQEEKDDVKYQFSLVEFSDVKDEDFKPTLTHHLLTSIHVRNPEKLTSEKFESYLDILKQKVPEFDLDTFHVKGVHHKDCPVDLFENYDPFKESKKPDDIEYIVMQGGRGIYDEL